MYRMMSNFNCDVFIKMRYKCHNNELFWLNKPLFGYINKIDDYFFKFIYDKCMKIQHKR